MIAKICNGKLIIYIDKLKEKKFKEYEKEVQKEEEQFIEEIVTTQRAMARIVG